MTVGEDPRLATGDIRPVVAGKNSNTGLWVFGVVAAGGALLLFSTLDGNRRALTAPATRPSSADLAATSTAPPPLYVPPAPVFAVRTLPLPAPTPLASPTPVPTPSPARVPVAAPVAPPPAPFRPEPPAQRSNEARQTGPVLVFDGSPGDAPLATNAANAAGGGPAVAVASGSTRTRAARLAGQRTTVPQGTLILAVLETALDSTRPGQARALVSRDVRGFDGSRVLIPRGSRLYGEYRADLAPGQNRALVQWTRLVRPDGVTIAIDSPAADALGRAGIRGKVNSHFLERFGGALLQSSLDLGVSLASQSIGDGSVILLPRGGQGVGSGFAPQQQIRPTLTVRQGTRVTVFVARDLDFASVDGR